MEHPAEMLKALLLRSEWLLVLGSSDDGQCAIVAVPHRDWIEWVVEPVRFKVGGESRTCCGSIPSQQRFQV